MNDKHKRNKIRLMERYHLVDEEMRKEIDECVKGKVYYA